MVKRYETNGLAGSWVGMDEEDEGYWVKYSDYQKLEQENKELKNVEKFWFKCEKFLRANIFDGEDRWYAKGDEVRFRPTDLRELMIEMIEHVLEPPK